MTATEAPIAPAAAPSGGVAGTYVFRNNLDAQGQMPAVAPYNLCPDIIRSGTAIEDPQAELTTAASMATLYDCDPDLNEENFFYLRALQGRIASGDQAGLYAAPAQLILFPDTWQYQLTTAENPAPAAQVEGAAPTVAVWTDPFVWQPAPPPPGSFYAYVAHVGPPPQVSDWLDMGTLLTQTPTVGFHNVGNVDGSRSWVASLGLNIPASFSAMTLALTITSSGFDGCILGMVGSRPTSDGHPILLNPIQLADGGTNGFQFPGDPGYSGTIYLWLMNGSGTVAPGSTINLLVSCLLPASMVEEAASRNLIDSGYARHVGESIGVGPQAVTPLGSVTFLAAGPAHDHPPQE